jgi:hypothetical protein
MFSSENSRHIETVSNEYEFPGDTYGFIMDITKLDRLEAQQADF